MDNSELRPVSLARRRTLPEYVAGSKGGPWYTSHTYPTKVPPETIVPFIEASTEVGGTVLDPFCGSGMTGVAVALSGRSGVLSDLSPGAVHLARNHTRRVATDAIAHAVDRFDRSWMRAFERDLYLSSVIDENGDRVEGLARHTVWSEIYACPKCRAESNLWAITEAHAGPLPRRIDCEACGAPFDRTHQRPLRSEPANLAIKPSGGGKLLHGKPSAAAIERISALQRRRLRHWIPDHTIDPSREMYIRSALHLRGVRTVKDMFDKRPALALSRLWHEIQTIDDAPVRESFEFAFTNTAWHSSRMRRYNAKGGQRPLTGTLFIPQLVSEPNVFEVFRNQLRQVSRLYEVLPDSDVSVRQSSATDLSWIPDGSIDYVFTDPPFGNNIHYADCNLVWESWLGEPGDNDAEIVVNKSRSVHQGGKTVSDYQRLLTEAFTECRRVVCPTGRVSIVFHNSDDAVWSALLDAVENAGLHQAEVSIMDKGQRSQKGYKARQGELVPFYDLVMTFTPDRQRFERLNGAGNIALDAVTAHLNRLDSGRNTTKRNLDYLYSVAVGEVIRSGQRPTGLSLRAFEQLCNDNLERVDNEFFVPGA